LPLAGFDDVRIKAGTTNDKQSAFILPRTEPCAPIASATFSAPAPYNRSRTGISTFNPCAACAQDYQAIDNRRFHIQTIACPSCAPKLSLLDEPGNLLAEKHEALREAIGQLQNGKIIAIKGIGGYQIAG